MRILALDLANNTGMAFGAATDRRPDLWTEVMGSPGSGDGQRFTEMMRTMLRVIDQRQPQVVVIEAPIVTGVKGGRARSEQAMGYRAHVVSACFIKGVRFEQFAVQSIRKHFIGKGDLRRDAAKQLAFERCKLLGWQATDLDQADAAALWSYAGAKLARVQTAAPFGLFDA